MKTKYRFRQFFSVPLLKFTNIYQLDMMAHNLKRDLTGKQRAEIAKISAPKSHRHTLKERHFN
jgi:hypothetical protein